MIIFDIYKSKNDHIYKLIRVSTNYLDIFMSFLSINKS